MKKVLVTGGNRGIGQAIAKRFREEGHVVYTPSREELNLLSKESIEKYILKNKLIGFDVIVNNAGINIVGELDIIEPQKLDEMLQVNLIAPMLLLGGLTREMKRKNYGRIVNIGSIWGVVSKPGRGGYAATKHAIQGITNTLALELAPYNILVNTVSPGFTLTELTRQNNSEKEIQEISSDIPLGRMAKPEEIAELVYFLGSSKNTYITGQQICIDGGFTIK